MTRRARSHRSAGIKVLARAHQNLIWTRQRQTNALRNALRGRSSEVERIRGEETYRAAIGQWTLYRNEALDVTKEVTQAMDKE